MTTKARITASLDPELVERVQRLVDEGAAPSMSSWLEEAMREKLLLAQRLAAMDEFLVGFDEEFGLGTEEEIQAGAAAFWATATRIDP